MTEESNNIIIFPRQKELPPLPIPASDINVKENVQNLYRNNIDSVVAVLTDFILDQLAVAGFRFDFTTDEYLKDLCLVVESLKSILYKYYQMDHKLQKISEEIFEKKDNIVSYKSTEAAEDKKEEFAVGIIEPTEEDFDDFND